MTGRAQGTAIAKVAAVVADTSRATMLLALLDGRAWTATELANFTGIARSTTTAHLNTLADAGFIEGRHQGKHRYVRLAGSRTAQLIELLGVNAAPVPAEQTLRSIRSDSATRAARTCYNHLAGVLGVGVYDAMVERNFLDEQDSLQLTGVGAMWCADLGVDIDALTHSRRPTVLPCLDWTERREHLAGGLGTALLTQFLARDWLQRVRESRALKVTDAGRAAFADQLGILTA